MTRLVARCPSWAWLLPLALLCLVVFGLGTDVLHWDEWLIWGELLQKMDSSTFSLTDLAAQQNEQRNLAARLFGLLLMPVSQLNRFAEFGVSILLAGAGLLSAMAIYRRDAGSIHPHVRLTFSLLTFSLLQWETFTLGSNTSVAVLPAALWCGLLVASGGSPTLPRLVVLGIIGILPSFSFANGLFYWLCLLPVLAYRAREEGVLVRALLIWTGMTSLAWLAYFFNFASPGHHPSLLKGLGHPVRLAGYFFAYLGGAVSSDKNLAPVAVAIGFFSLPLFMGLAWREWLAGGDRRKHLLPWLGAAGFTMASAAVTTLARAEFGMEQALESRYATFSSPYWVALAALFFMGRNTDRPRTLTSRVSTTFLGACIVVFLVSTLLSSVVVFNRNERFERAREALFTLTDEDALKTIFPDTAYLVARRSLLMRKKLSVFRDLPELDAYTVRAEPGGSFTISGEGRLADGRVLGVVVEGVQGTKGAVVLTADKRIVAYLPHAGKEWKAFIPHLNLPIGPVSLEGFVIVDGTLAPMSPQGAVEFSVEKAEPMEFQYQEYFFAR